MDRDGEAKLYAGDVIVLQIRFFDETEIRELLAGLVGTQYEIIKRS